MHRHITDHSAVMAPAFVEFMQKLQRLHQHGKSIAKAKCPKCGEKFGSISLHAAKKVAGTNGKVAATKKAPA